MPKDEVVVSGSPESPSPGQLRGTLVYDGDCGFCRLWVERWRRLAGQGVTFIPFQEARIDGLDQASCMKAVQWVGADGTRASGAEAVFRLLAEESFLYALLLKAYLACRPFAWITRVGYEFVADHRPAFSWATKLLWGKDVRSPTFGVATTWFLRALGAIYLLAFVSFWVQAPGLVGSTGIAPSPAFFQQAEEALGGKNFHLLPSVLWFSAGDTALAAWSAAGVLASLGILFGIFRAPALIVAWAVYLSLCLGGGVFYQFQWDILLLETGFLAVFLTPWTIRATPHVSPPRLARFLLVWLLFRLVFASGVVKLSSGDPTWWPALTALDFHYVTQPLPTPLAWFAHQWPSWFQKASVLVMFFIELVLPFFIFAPRRLRLLAAAGFVFLQALIIVTGNYGFFNLLTLA
ncbi:MAG: lipase maturation factor family protein, partial [Terrimicrobiaceae bacterium]